MPCTRPRTASQQARGAPLNWRKKHYKPNHQVYQLPCGKCVSCRLTYGRTWAIRCMHESEMHGNSIFLTLTYDDDHVGNNKLNYRHFQDFIRALRAECPGDEISYIVAGEYGKRTKRQHWHAILFGFYPKDASHKYTSERGDRVSSSQIVDEIWGRGISEFGAVTLESAGYVARYSAKKLVHGRDGDHQYDPIFKVSSKYAIGKRWIEKHWKGVFEKGFLLTESGEKVAIPRYYEKWLEKNQPEYWLRYVTGAKQKKIDLVASRQSKETAEWQQQFNDKADAQRLQWNNVPKTQLQVKEEILNQKFKELQKRQKDT